MSALKPKPALKRVPRLSLTTQFPTVSAIYPARKKIKSWVLAAMQEDMIVTVRLVDEAEARTLNRQYRGRDYATNVLSFGYQTTPCSGDLILCAPIIEQESMAQGKDLEAHYAHLVIHGILHLQGFDHEQDASAKLMEALETAVMHKLGFENPYNTALQIT